jgi:hypothetical protein
MANNFPPSSPSISLRSFSSTPDRCAPSQHWLWIGSRTRLPTSTRQVLTTPITATVSLPTMEDQSYVDTAQSLLYAFLRSPQQPAAMRARRKRIWGWNAGSTTAVRARIAGSRSRAAASPPTPGVYPCASLSSPPNRTGTTTYSPHDPGGSSLNRRHGSYSHFDGTSTLNLIGKPVEEGSHGRLTYRARRPRGAATGGRTPILRQRIALAAGWQRSCTDARVWSHGGRK